MADNDFIGRIIGDFKIVEEIYIVALKAIAPHVKYQVGKALKTNKSQALELARRQYDPNLTT